MSNKNTIVFCDGACSGNPGPGGWGSVICFSGQRVLELGGGQGQTTNNQMEMIGLIEALKALRGETGTIEIYLDSVYVIRGATEWVHGWKRRGWKNFEGNPVANIPLWEELDSLVRSFPKKQLKWGYVRGHVGIAGNERVDEIAVAFSKGERIYLYDGPLSAYDHDIYKLPADTSVPEMKYGTGEKKVAYSYLSVIGGVPERHKTWAECEARVKGRSGAKFKKAMSAVEESVILEEWGFDPNRVK